MMKKRLLLCAGSLVVLGGLGWLGLTWSNERSADLPAPSAKEMPWGAAALASTLVPEPPLPPSRVVRLAIGGLGFPDDHQNQLLGDLLTAQLAGAKGLELVDRQSLGKVLRELELNLSGLVRPKDAVRVGKLLRAEWFLLGTSATIGGTNSILVARVVDARTGIMRDVGVFSPAKAAPALAAELAGFVRRTREGASGAKPRTFLGVGTLTDVGLNRRQEEFPQQLRAYLTQAYQASEVTLLERDQVSTLLQEVHLDLAGLTDGATTNAPQPMQSAFWLVNGFYQSFGSSGEEVELVLQLNRAFGGSTNFSLHGLPEAPFFQRVKAAIDTTMAQASPTLLAPSWISELRHQLAMGEQLWRTATGGVELGFFEMQRLPDLREQDYTKRRGYLTEAARAFETALLLEPDNGEARFYLSACFCEESFGRYADGVAELRSLAGSSAKGEWPQRARVALGYLYGVGLQDEREAARWFTEAATHARNARVAATWQGMAQLHLSRAAQKEASDRGDADTNATSRAALEDKLLGGIESSHNVLKGHGGGIDASYGVAAFVGSYGTNRAAAARHLVELLPTLKQKYPDMVPHLLGSVLSFQPDTNTVLLAEFRASVAGCVEHPEQVLGCQKYFNYLLYGPYDWCLAQKLYPLALDLVEAKRQAALRQPEIKFTGQDKVRLAFIYLRQEDWRHALSVFEELGDTAVVMEADGPWGKWGKPFLPDRQGALCREKLGLPQPANAGLFALDKACLCLHTPSSFTAAPDGLWVGIGAKLLQLGFDLHTNKVVSLPISGYQAWSGGIKTVCVGPEKVWVGTAQEGLVEYNKASGQCRQLTDKHGLLLNDISALYLQNNTLWIGYGNHSAGGLGTLDLATGHISGFTPKLPANPLAGASADPLDGPPRHAVSGLTLGLPGELWMLVSERGLCRYRIPQNTWDTVVFRNGVSAKCFGVYGDRLLAGLSVNQIRLLIENERRAGDTNAPGRTERIVTDEEEAQWWADPALRRRIRGSIVGNVPFRADLRVRSLTEERWQPLSETCALPLPPEVMEIVGSDLWLGGPGYIAVVDLTQKKLRARCSVAANSVERLQVAGGYLWAQFDWHLHKVPLSAAQ